MGVFSKVHRFREAGEAANVNNVEHFGLMNRDAPPSWREPELIEAIMDVVNGKTEAKKDSKNKKRMKKEK